MSSQLRTPLEPARALPLHFDILLGAFGPYHSDSYPHAHWAVPVGHPVGGVSKYPSGTCRERSVSGLRQDIRGVHSTVSTAVQTYADSCMLVPYLCRARNLQCTAHQRTYPPTHAQGSPPSVYERCATRAPEGGTIYRCAPSGVRHSWAHASRQAAVYYCVHC